MLIDPERIVFEKRGDIVDYISGGILPPTRSQFNRVMDKVRTPDEAGDTLLECKKGREVVITNTVVPNDDIKILDDVLTRVYENRVETTNKVLFGIGIGIVGILLYSLFSSDKKDEDYDTYLEREFSNKEKGTYVDQYGNEITVF